MKKIISLILAAMLILAAIPALAEVVTIPDTSLKLDIGASEEFELTAEEIAEDIVMFFGDDAETYECAVYVEDAEGLTLDDMEAVLAEDENITAAGLTVINGITCMYYTSTEDGENYVGYILIEDDLLVEFVFWYASDAAAQQTGVIMGTLSR